MKSILFLLLSFLLSLSVAAQNPFEGPKREMRGAWIQCVNGQFMGLSREQMQANLTQQLDVLHAVGVNTIMFQVRAEADALYESPYEPWSRFLTGRQGQHPGWDPLARKGLIHACNSIPRRWHSSTIHAKGSQPGC